MRFLESRGEGKLSSPVWRGAVGNTNHVVRWPPTLLILGFHTVLHAYFRANWAGSHGHRRSVGNFPSYRQVCFPFTLKTNPVSHCQLCGMISWRLCFRHGNTIGVQPVNSQKATIRPTNPGIMTFRGIRSGERPFACVARRCLSASCKRACTRSFAWCFCHS